MWGLTVKLAVVVAALSSLFPVVEGDAGGFTCSPSEDDAFGALIGRKLLPHVCLEAEEDKNNCCRALGVPWPNCTTWGQCPRADLPASASSMCFINTKPEGEDVLTFLNEQCPCKPQHPPSTPTPSKLVLILHPIYSWSDINPAGFGPSLVRLPTVFAGANVHIAMDHPNPQDITHCCCCLRLDYYLTWSQMRVFGWKSGRTYLADWINVRWPIGPEIGRGMWSNETCSSTKLEESSTIASGNAIFENADFNVTYAVNKIANAGFSMNDLTIQISVTAVVALSEYCYKIKGPDSDCHYKGGDLKGCVYSKPQVLKTLAAGQAAYQQIIYVNNGEPHYGEGKPYSHLMDQDDLPCLQKFAGNGSRQFRTVDNFCLNINNSFDSERQSPDFEPLTPKFFNNHTYCSGM